MDSFGGARARLTGMSTGLQRGFMPAWRRGETHIHSEAMRTCAEVERPGVAALLLLVADAHLAIKVAMLVDELASANVLLG